MSSAVCVWPLPCDPADSMVAGSRCEQEGEERAVFPLWLLQWFLGV